MRRCAKLIVGCCVLVGIAWGCGETSPAAEPGKACAVDDDCPDPSGCQSNTCNLDIGECQVSLKANFCLIENVGGESICYPAGDIHESDQCKECDPFQDPDQWVAIQCESEQSCIPDKGCISTEILCGGDDAKCVTTNACMEGTCDADGICSFSPVVGAECDDDDACTTGDVCNAAGECGGQFDNELCDCESDDQCTSQECIDVACVANECVLTDVADDTGCDDGDACTETDVCTAGTCAGTPKDCPAPPECMNSVCETTCDGDGTNCTATCTTTPVAAGQSCDDDQSCTANDVCDGNGACAGEWDSGVCECQTVADCKDPAPTCQELTCEDHQCGTASADEGNGCDNGDQCTENDTCQAGQCVSGSTVQCADTMNDCTSNECNSAVGCELKKADVQTDCDDGLFCTINDHCDGQGSCIGGGDKVCEDSDINPCKYAQCDESKDQCGLVNATNTLPCETDDVCVEEAECQNGQCIQTAAVQCVSDGNDCTTATCVTDGNKGCEHNPVAAGTACGAEVGYCFAWMWTPADYCDDSGVCISPATAPCSGLLYCDGQTKCKTSCSTHYDCLSPAKCTNGKCTCTDGTNSKNWTWGTSGGCATGIAACGNLRGQSFTLAQDAQFLTFTARLRRQTGCKCSPCTGSSSGNVTLSLYKVDSAGKPTGDALSTASMSISSLGISNSYQWETFNFQSKQVYLDGGTQYAAVLSSSTNQDTVLWQQHDKSVGDDGSALAKGDKISGGVLQDCGFSGNPSVWNVLTAVDNRHKYTYDVDCSTLP